MPVAVFLLCVAFLLFLPELSMVAAWAALTEPLPSGGTSRTYGILSRIAFLGALAGLAGLFVGLFSFHDRLIYHSGQVTVALYVAGVVLWGVRLGTSEDEVRAEVASADIEER